MKNIIVLCAAVILLLTGSKSPRQVAILISQEADSLEVLAAHELSHYLGVIYPAYEFPVSATSQGSPHIFVGIQESIPREFALSDTVPANPEGFRVAHWGADRGLITASGSAGVLYGVYELLEALGYSFVLSGDYAPSPRETFDFEDWNLVNQPLVAERTIFNWHNFLSGSTAWDYAEWVLWINQSQKMGFNTIMVHAYANNPMFTFEYGGMTKPVGYLASSVQGRDWSTEHVNDVRRLPGGSVFDAPVFGSEAAKVPEEQKTAAVQQMMKRVFQHARERGVKINFALDFDMVAAIPQQMVAKIPATDKFTVRHAGISWMGEAAGDVSLPRPDRPEGYAYYRQQVASVIERYPQINKFILWRRTDGTVWNELKKEEMPMAWQKVYDERVDNKPEIAQMYKPVSAFAQSKLAGAYRQAFDELGRSDVALAYGTWRWEPVLALNEFYPDYTSLYILDSEVIRDTLHLHNQALIEEVASYIKPGKLIPVIWPHHDDGAYLGAPLPAYQDFHTTLTKLKASGYGVIHWMTRPFDLFFIHHARQVTQQTRNRSLGETLTDLGHKWFGDNNAGIMTNYLEKYVREAPSFGRETGPYFIKKAQYHQFAQVDSTLAASDDRLTILNSVDTAAFSEDQRETYRYFLKQEDFIQEFYRQQGRYQDFLAKIDSGKVAEATALAREFDPARAVEKYAEAIQCGQMTKGEQGIVFSMGARWIPHFLSQKQRVGLESIRLNIGPTSHEDIAQNAGARTYLLDAQRDYWQVKGKRETGREVAENPRPAQEYQELFEQGIRLDSVLTMPVEPFTTADTLVAGSYTLKLLLASGEQPSTVRVTVNGTEHPLTVSGNAVKAINVTLTGEANPTLRLVAEDAETLLCGVIMEPQESKGTRGR